VAGDIATRYVRIRPDTSGFKQETNKQVEEALKGVKKSIAAAIGGAGVFEILKSTFEAAAGKQSAAAQIETTVKNAGAAWTVYGKTVEQILNEQEGKTGFDFEEQAQAFGRLEQQFKNTPKALDALNSAMDIARARHADLATVAVSLARAEAGNTQSLSRLGIVLPKYTAAQDALKASILDVKKAEEAKAQAGAKNYQGTINLTAAQKVLASQSLVALKNREAELKSQLAAAAASDKSVGATRALAEVQRRYAGQTESFLGTAAGASARFHVAIQQLQEELGGQFLPSITSALNATSDWVLSLAESEDVQRGAATAAHDLASAVETIADGVQKLAPLIGVVQSFVDVFGVGPILGFVTALKLVPAAMVRFGVTEAGLSAETLALQGSIDGVQAGITELSATILAATAPEAALAAETTTLAAAQMSLFEATELAAGAQLSLLSSTELAAAGEATLGAVTLETAAATDVATASSVAFGSAIFGPLGLIIGASLLAGGLIYLSQQQSLVSKTTDQATEAFKRQEDAATRAAQAARDVSTARGSLPDLEAQRRSARAALTAAEAARDTVYGSGTASDADVASADAAVISARQRVRDANTQVLATEKALKGAVDAGKKARQDERKSVQSIIDTQLALAKVEQRDVENKSAATRGLLSLQAQVAKVNPAVDQYAAALAKASAHTKGLSDEARNELAALGGLAKGLGRLPTEKEIKLVLDTKGFMTTLEAAKSTLSDIVAGALGQGAGPGSRGAQSTTVRVKKAGGQLGSTAAASFSQSFVQHIDVSGIAQAFKDSLATAQQNVISQSGSLADSVAAVLDERLRRTTLPLTAQITAIQKSLDAESAAKAARDAGTAVADAQAKLDQLRSVYGSGALTAGQSKEISDAQTALQDAQASVADQAKQARIKSLQDQIDAAGKAEEIKKASAQRSLADLADEFSRGKISQEKYLAGVRELLGKQQVTFKSAGKLLGTSFADGFSDALQSLFAQVPLLAAVGRGTLKGAQRGTKATNPAQDQAKAIQAVVDQIAGSGGKFSLDNLGTLPKGVNLPALISAAKTQRSTDEYQTTTKKQGAEALTYAQQSRDHLATAVALLRDGKNVHVTVTDKAAAKKTRTTAKATNQ
jgi:hypothetical protein